MDKLEQKRRILLVMGSYLDKADPSSQHLEELFALNIMLCDAMGIEDDAFPDDIIDP